ncbi:MAG: sulfur carrier protein ThiS [Actinomycetota bacterium]|nr:MAG: sulfur carrier protein ThiS [Actinomycetota bacterium]
MTDITVRLNGSDRALAAGSTVAAAVATLTTTRAGVAVAVDGVIVPRTQWPSTVLTDGAEVEVLTAVQGG